MASPRFIASQTISDTRNLQNAGRSIAFQFFLSFSPREGPSKNKEAISLSKPARLFCIIAISFSHKWRSSAFCGTK
jgi:hypothetical protein